MKGFRKLGDPLFSLSLTHRLDLGDRHAGASSVIPLLDGQSNVAAAYSTRKLRSSYTGDCVLLRRSTDSAEQAFGFAADGWVNSASITDWLAGASAYVKTWYDQSGNGNDETQTTPGKQPQLVLSAINSKPSLRFAGAQGLKSGNINLTATNQAGVLMVANITDNGVAQIPFEHNTSLVATSFDANTTAAGLFEVALRGNVGFASFDTNGKAIGAAGLYSCIYDMSLATNEPYLYINGLLASGTRPTNNNNTGNFGNTVFCIGARNATSAYMTGDMSEIILFSNTITNRATLEAAIVGSYGLASSVINVVFEGDSLTWGDVGGTTNYPVQAMAVLYGGGRLFVWRNQATNGATLVTMTADAPTQVDAYYTSLAAENILVIWGGTNDMHAGATPDTTHNRLSPYCGARQAVGWTVITLTMLPRSDAGTLASYADRADYNNLISANWPGYADVLVDIAADTDIGEDGDELNPVYYQADKSHLTTAGYGIVAAAVAAAINALL